MKRRGKMGGMAGSILPVLGAGLVTLGGTLALRTFLTPEPGTRSETIYRWAPGFAGLAGLIASGAFYWMGGTQPAAAAGLTTVLAAGGLLASERLNAAKPGAMIALGGSSASLPAGGGADAGAGPAGMGALVPETGMGAIVWDNVRGAEPGTVVNLQGAFEPSAFGKAPY